MKCPRCGEGNVDIGADGKVYCPDCMTELEGFEFTLQAERIAERLDDFLDSAEDKTLALEFVQSWVWRYTDGH